jgi:PAS domain S-box-containing protein
MTGRRRTPPRLASPKNGGITTSKRLASLIALVYAFSMRRESRKKAVSGAQQTDILSESDQPYRAIVETQTELICRYLPDTTLTFVNEAYSQYFGKKRGDLIGRSFLDLLPENARNAAKNHVQSLCERPREIYYEHPVIGRSGEIRWQQWVDRVVLDPDGHIVELQAVGRDITERKQMEMNPVWFM